MMVITEAKKRKEKKKKKKLKPTLNAAVLVQSAQI